MALRCRRGGAVRSINLGLRGRRPYLTGITPKADIADDQHGRRAQQGGMRGTTGGSAAPNSSRPSNRRPAAILYLRTTADTDAAGPLTSDNPLLPQPQRPRRTRHDHDVLFLGGYVTLCVLGLS